MLPGYSSLLDHRHKEVIGEIKRKDFDKDFIFGSATLAYQFEGAYDEDGKGPSIWDNWTRLRPEKVDGGTNGNVAVDHYHLYKDDIQMMKKTGLEAYRFSISWPRMVSTLLQHAAQHPKWRPPRILPDGKINSGTNKKGIEYYNNLINELIANGIEPCVTLFHWDLPLALELAYNGFLSGEIVQDFVEYAGLCFWEFGDRVKTWITFNEGWTYCNFGYNAGTFPPGRGTDTKGCKTKYKYCAHKGAGCYIPEHCANGDAGTEPYIAAHNMLLAHTYAVQLYRTQYQENQGGKIGITNNFHFFEPLNDTDEDRKACIRGIDWMFGWFTAPVTTGDYPANMRKTCGDRLPEFCQDEVKLVKGSYDFIGLNYYTTMWATLIHKHPDDPDTFQSDRGIIDSSERTLPDGTKKSIGDPTGANWLYIVPRGLYNALVYAKQTYNIDLFYITENVRVKYYREHLWYLKKAICEAKINVKQYYLWSLGDNFEWAQGYTYRFGTFYIDFANGQLTRTPKSSAIWWRNFFNKNTGPKDLVLKRDDDSSCDVEELPEDYRDILSRSVEGAESLLKKFPCKKNLDCYFCTNDVSIDNGLKVFRLKHGKKRYIVGSKDLIITCGKADTKFISHPESWFPENIELEDAVRLSISGLIKVSMLSPETTYRAYLYYSSNYDFDGLRNVEMEGCLGLKDEPFRARTWFYLYPWKKSSQVDDDVKLPILTNGGFYKVEIGEFYVKRGYEDRELYFYCKEEKSRKDLIVLGIGIVPIED